MGGSSLQPFRAPTLDWGVGFYGPPIYLHTVQETHGWSLNMSFHGSDGPLSVWCDCGRKSAEAVPALRRVACYKGRIDPAWVGVAGWALAKEPLAAFPATLVQRCRMGDHGRCRSQRNHRTMVASERGRRRYPQPIMAQALQASSSPLSGCHNGTVRISLGHSGDWPHHDCYHLDFGGCVKLCQGARADGIDP